MTYASEVAADTPVMWWRLGEASGTTVSDASGNGRDGTYDDDGQPVSFAANGLNQPSLIDGDADTAVHLGYRTDIGSRRWYASRATDSATYIATTGELSVELSYRYTGLSLGGAVLVATQNDWILALEGTGLRLRVGHDSSGATIDVPDVDVLDGHPHHIVVEIKRDTGTATYLRRITVDGQVKVSSTASFSLSTPGPGGLRLARNRTGALASNSFVTGVYDELVVYDHVLTTPRVVAHWNEAWDGSVWPKPLDLGLTLPPSHVFIAQWIAADALDLGLTMGTHSLRVPLRPAGTNDTDSVQGPVAPLTPGALYPSPISGVTEVPGIYVAPTPADAIPLRPASVASLTAVPGAWLPVPATNPEWPIPIPVPPSPTYPDGYMYVEGRMTVSGITSVVGANCAPTMNGPGSGSFTRKGPVTPNRTQVSFHVAGKTTMTGFVTSSQDIVVDGGEESAQLQTMNVDATAAELDDIIILPDFGSQDIGRLGLPTQDMRVFDWTANGVGDWSGDGALYTPGTTPVPQMMASGVDILAADEPLGGPWNSAFPLPDVWPDNNSQWINWISPRIPAPAGWALFYVATPKPPAGKVQFWLCAYDYAELWVDGVKTVVCNTPGKSEHIEIEMTSDHHMLAIRLYTRGGAAGVMSTMLPVNKSDQLYGPPTMNTRSGWTAIPVHDAFIYTPGAVLQRLFYEARERGNSLAKKWTLTFTNKLDSNGRPWPIPEWPIELDVGTSYLDALGVLAETYIDWTESPGGWKLNAYIKGQGTGRSAANAWTAGVNALSIARDKAIRE